MEGMVIGGGGIQCISFSGDLQNFKTYTMNHFSYITAIHKAMLVLFGKREVKQDVKASGPLIFFL